MGIRLLLLGLLLASIVGYHYVAVHRAHTAGVQEGKDWGRALVQKASDANAKLHADTQDLITIRIGPENAELQTEMTRLQDQLAKKAKVVFLPGKPVPAICEPDPERVAWVNEARS